jgi:hypothetical protein
MEALEKSQGWASVVLPAVNDADRLNLAALLLVTRRLTSLGGLRTEFSPGEKNREGDSLKWPSNLRRVATFSVSSSKQFMRSSIV